MIGNGYWSTGIVVAYSDWHGGAWSAEVEYFDSGFCDDDAANGIISTQGKLNTRYAVRDGSEATLTAVIDVIKADAERLGITFRAGGGAPNVYYKGDGENGNYPPPPNWRGLIDAQSRRLGWQTVYGSQS
jgi:hypothetical protein